MSSYYAALAQYYPENTFAQYNSLSDRVQARYYAAISGDRQNCERAEIYQD